MNNARNASRLAISGCRTWGARDLVQITGKGNDARGPSRGASVCSLAWSCR